MKRKTLFRLKKMTALLCAVVMCVMTLQPIAFAGPIIPTKTDVSLKLISAEGITWYTDNGYELSLGYLSDNGYYCDTVSAERPYTFILKKYDVDNNKDVTLANETIVLYAKVDGEKSIQFEDALGVGATIEQSKVTLNDGSKLDYKITVSITASSGEVTLEAKVVTAQVTVDFPVGEFSIQVLKAGQYVEYGGKLSVDKGDDVSFKIVGGDESKLYTPRLSGGYTLTESEGVYTISGVRDDITVSVVTTDKTVKVAAPTPDASFTYTPITTKLTYGGNFEFYLSPKAGYGNPAEVSYIKDDEKTVIYPVDNNTRYMIPNVTSDITISVTPVAKNTYSVDFAGEGFTAKIGENNTLEYDSDVTFTVTPDTGYEIKAVKVGNKTLTADNGTYKIEKITADVTVTVEVKKKSINISYPAANNAYAVTGPASVDYGDSLTFYVVTKEGYEAPTEVRVNGESVEPISGNQYIYPVNAEDSITISVTGGDKIMYSVKLPSGTGFKAFFGTNDNDKIIDVEHNGMVEFTVTPNDGYRITSLAYVAADGKTTAITVTADGKYSVSGIKGNITIAVEVEQIEYNITFNAPDEGYSYKGAATATYGEYTFTVETKTGYKDPVVKVGNDTIIPVNNVYTVNITDHTTIEITSGGKITFDVDFDDVSGVEFATKQLTSIDYNGSFTFTVAVVDDTYDVGTLKVYANGVIVPVTSVDGIRTYTIKNITAAQIVTATIEKRDVQVTLLDGAGYTLKASGNTALKAGDTFNFTVTVKVEDGYTYDSEKGYTVVTNNGSTVFKTADNAYSIKNVTQDTVISVDGITVRTYDLNTEGVSNATIEHRWGDLTHGSDYEFKVIAATGYRILTVSVNGISYEPIGDIYTVKNVTGDLRIVVETVANVLTVNYVSTRENHEHEYTKTFRIDTIQDVLTQPINECTIHKFSGWTVDGVDNLNVDYLMSLIATGDNDIILTASFETEKIDWKSIVTLSNGRRVNIANGANTTIQIKADLAIPEEFSNEKCLDLTGLTVTFGTMICNSEQDPNRPEVETAIITGENYYSDGNNVVIVFVSEKVMTLTELNGHTIYMSVNTSTAAAETVMRTASFVKFTIDNDTFVVIG